MGLPVGQEYRDLQKLIPGVQYTQDQMRGPSAGGSGQDNVYQFDGVNVTLPLFGTLSAEPASHDIAAGDRHQGRRPRRRLRPLRRLLDRLGQQVGHRRVPRPGSATSSRPQPWRRTSAAAASRATSRTATWLNANLGGPILEGPPLLLRLLLPPDTQSRDNRANLYGELPDYDSTRNEGFGKLTFTPTKTILLNVSYRDSKRVDTGDLFAANAARHHRHRRRGAAEDRHRRRLVGHQLEELRHRSSTPTSRTRPRAGPTTSPTSSISTAVGHAARHRTASTRRALSRCPCRSPARPPTTRSSSRSSTATATLVNGVQTGGGIVGYGSQFDNDDFFRDARAGRLQPHARHERGPRDLHVGYQWYTRRGGPLAQLERLGHHDPRRRGRLARPCQAMLRPYYTALPAADAGRRCPPIHSEYQLAELRAQRHDQVEGTGPSTSACSRATTRSTARACAKTPRRSPATCSAPGNKYKMYEIPFSKMIQPRVGATWAYNGKDTIYASYATLQPGGELAAARRVVGPQPRRTSIDALLRRERRAVRGRSRGLVVGQAVRRRPDAAHGQRVPGVGTRAAVRPALVRPRLRPLPRGRPLLGGHEQQRAGRLQPAARAFPRELYIPDLAAQLAPDRQRVDLRHRRARRRLHQVLRGDRWSRSGAATRPSSAARTPGATTTATSTRTTRRDGQRRQHLHRLVEHRRRRRPPALELQGRRPARRPAAHRSSSTATDYLPWQRERRRLRRRPVRPAVGARGATSPTAA